MKNGFVYMRSTNLISFRETGAYSRSAPEAWARMFDWLSRNGLRGIVDRGFGMAHDDPRTTAGADCRYDACIEVPQNLPRDVVAELAPLRLPSGPYAKHRFIGPHSQLGAVARDLREQWSSRHGLSIAVARPLVEIYLDDPGFCEPKRLRTDICLPIAFNDNRIVA